MRSNLDAALLPPTRRVLTTTEAAAYCGFKTPSAIRKAQLEGRLTPEGRRGGKGTWMWLVDELDRFLRGASVDTERSGMPRPRGEDEETKTK